MASKLKRTIYTHSGVRISPQIDLLNPNDWWNELGWASGVVGSATQGYAQPRTVQNATFTLNIPRADVNVFGVLGVVDRPQLEAETATVEFSFIPEKDTAGAAATNWAAGVAAQKVILPADINAMKEDAIAQAPRYVDVWADGVGRIKTALMNSLSAEATIGALPTMTMGFTGRTHNYLNLDASSVDETGDILPPAPGVGALDESSAPYEGPLHPTQAGCFAEVDALGDPLCPTLAKDFAVSLVEPEDINLAWSGNVAVDGAQETPPVAHAAGGNANYNLVNERPEHTTDGGAIDVPDVESQVNPDVDQGIQTGCAQSASFSWDLPVETILCLGGNPKMDGHTLGNPPGTSSFTVEALSLQLEKNTNAQDYFLVMGVYGFEMTNGAIDSRTHNLAVGDLFGSYNYVIGSTADSIKVM
jgi:hypothetical protein